MLIDADAVGVRKGTVCVREYAADAVLPLVLTSTPIRPFPLLLSPRVQALLLQFPYHQILCWGYDATRFQWRAFVDDAETDATVSVPASDE